MTSPTLIPQSAFADAFDLVCFSHLRWDFVYQRPQHLLTRFAAQSRVFYFEEPVSTSEPSHLRCSRRNSGVQVIVPYLSERDDPTTGLRLLIDEFFASERIHSYVLWFYTPMHLLWTKHLKPLAVVYDCMDELSSFKGAPPDISQRETELMQWADIMFTGGHSLFEAKRGNHDNIYPFPSSIDVRHFARARTLETEPNDQASIPGIRLGFFGVIDERMDLELVAAVARLRPEWHVVMIGPVVKIDPAVLPKLSNIHYLGMKSYDELPLYIAGWDVALLPFARNDSTRFISPTKTPEYLAAGLAVVSTSIRDVICPYGDAGVVYIADTPEEFVAATEKALTQDSAQHLKRVDGLLSQTSWSRTWGRMAELLDDVVQRRRRVHRSGGPTRQLAATAVAGGRT